MSIINNFFNKKKKGDALAAKIKSREKFKETDDKEKVDDKEKKDLTIRELKEKEAGTPKIAKEKKQDTKDAYRVLIKPLVTEKGTYLSAHNKYLFEVAPFANKVMVKKAIKALYGIMPTKVNIVKIIGKKTRYGRITGRTKDKKKAIVTLPKGESIQIYEGV
jgi:large subunit ribosomal protein L23